MDIIELIKKRVAFGLDHREKDLWLEEEIQSNKDRFEVILPENALDRYHGPDADNLIYLSECYGVAGMFELGNVLPNTNAKMILYIFSKKQNESPETFTIGAYYNTMRSLRMQDISNIDYNKLYPFYFYNYIHIIEECQNNSDLTDQEPFFCFNVVDKTKFIPNVYSPRRYTKKVFEIENKLRNEKTLLLSDIADIIRPRPSEDRTHTVKVLTPNAWVYPFQYERLQENRSTDAPIRHGDILFRDFDHMYLVNEELKEEVHINPNFYIIRTISISPYYLYLYLQTETAKTIMQSLSMGSVLSRIRRQDMMNIPVIKPQNDEKYYQKQFELQISSPKNISDFYASEKKIDSCETIADILEQELLDNMQMCKVKTLGEFLKEDLRELNACYRTKAYKATLIMAGSILEAILIDWLSEIKGINYFEEDYIIVKNGRTKKADLIDYIKEIEIISKPKWMKASEAHMIRQKRNLVHAKLCMSSDTEINFATCNEVIQYLKEVIETRGVSQSTFS